MVPARAAGAGSPGGGDGRSRHHLMVCHASRTSCLDACVAVEAEITRLARGSGLGLKDVVDPDRSHKARPARCSRARVISACQVARASSGVAP